MLRRFSRRLAPRAKHHDELVKMWRESPRGWTRPVRRADCGSVTPDQPRRMNPMMQSVVVSSTNPRTAAWWRWISFWARSPATVLRACHASSWTSMTRFSDTLIAICSSGL
ncbi:hypothetical protein TcG_00369 [Trypanosoma cruzi]|nr:hypothetical protein TcG_00369 [Trypanosoma cruzi]